MKLKKEKMCKIAKKELFKDEPEKFLELITFPKYICKKCGLVSTEDNLCKVEKLKDYFKE